MWRLFPRGGSAESRPGPLELTLHAQDLFFSSARNFTLNFTNARPVCNLTSALGAVSHVAALQEFTREVDLTALCFDPDGDALEFAVSQASLPSWLRADIKSTVPQKLRLSGSAPGSAQGSNFTVNVILREDKRDSSKPS